MSFTDETKRAGYLNESIFCTLLLIFSAWRCTKQTYTNMNTYKGRMRFVGSFFIIGSILSTFVYNAIIWYLSGKVILDKYDFEANGFLHNSFILQYKDFKVDLSELLNVFYMTAKIFRMSSVFMLIGLWGPCLYSFCNAGYNNSTFYKYRQFNDKVFISKDIFHTSIVTFSKIYSVFRIPALVYVYYKLRNLEVSSLVFFESFFMSAEIYLCIALLLVLQTKHNFISGYKGMDTVSLLGICLGIFGFLNYSINSITFPFSVSNTSYQIVQSLVFALKLVIDILLVNMFCPLDGQVFDEVDARKEKEIEINYETRELIPYK